MRYACDPAKNAANIRKHDIGFDDAVRVFEGDVLGWPDERFDYGEARWIAIGLAGGEETVVVYTEKGDERRILSARRAIRKERELYWRGRS
jgi:uncharacterized DUF497 family protein